MNHQTLNSLGLIVFVLLLGAGTSMAQSTVAKPRPKAEVAAKLPVVTFIELGSVNCIPCKAMQPVMKAIETKYGEQVKVVFYDVWTKEHARYAQVYRVRLIPTQVFLDANGKEFFRHEGFFPEEAIHDLFKRQGLDLRIKG